MWLDLVTLAALGGAALGVSLLIPLQLISSTNETNPQIHLSPLVSTRTFPVTFDQSNHVVFPTLAYPNRGWIINSWLSGLLCSVIPIAVVLLAQFRVRSFWDANNGITGVSFSLLMGTLFQVVVKQLIGGFRPYFLEACVPDTSLAPSRNASGLNGVGFQQAFYTSEICTQQDKNTLKVAMTSFPSGHTTVAAAGFGFLYLYVNGKLKVFSARRARLWEAALLFAPLLAAFLMAAILTVDQTHHWYDILAGAAIGSVSALSSYRACYAAIWDWRFNHVPLARHQAFSYDADRPGYTQPAARKGASGGIGGRHLEKESSRAGARLAEPAGPAV